MATSPSAVPIASGSDMASLPAVWAYILPALDHIMRSPSRLSRGSSAGHKATGRSGMISHGFNLGLGLPGDEEGVFPTEDPPKDWNLDRVERIKSMAGYELYGNLEDYFRGVAREVRTKAPHNDSALLTYYLATYTRYASGVAIINRLFAYLNRHFITRAVDDGMGWISLQDILKEKRTGKKTKKDIELLETQAGSPPERIIPVASLAHRCWRTEVIEPFTSAGIPKATENPSGVDPDLAPRQDALEPPGTPASTNGATSKQGSPSSTVPESLTPKANKKNKRKKKSGKDKGKGKDDDMGSPNSGLEMINRPSTPTNLPISGPPSPTSLPSLSLVQPPPKGRLNRVVGDLILTSGGPAAPHAREMAAKLSRSLKASGVSPDNIIRKRLDKFLKR
ncbi:hypothetical protein BS47DRAFT_1392996 [Hydnum rufescens UP504]|uniref:Uncharacterized protein n=1 Tax=Hydnum rufescens UP504 TaxID=1448309 RepID=A0A9P6AXF0_9AGAM|nr:hypothetical protein BS47DRAFT_1392996 [Hydnum rufescens UP504]